MKTSASVRPDFPAESCMGCGAAVVRNPEQAPFCHSCAPPVMARVIAKALALQLRLERTERRRPASRLRGVL